MYRYTLIILSLTLLLPFPGKQLEAAESPADIACAGSTGAAYGLCVAAHHLGCGTDDEKSTQACTRIEDNFLKLTGEMPPWLVECPCWTPEILDAGGVIDQCIDGLPEDPTTAAVSWYRDGFACSGEFCAQRAELSCGIHYNALGAVIIESPISLEEHKTCRRQIVAVCADFSD